MGILLETGRTEDPLEEPLQAAQGAPERPAGSLRRRPLAPRGDPRRPAAERAAAPDVAAVGPDVDGSQELDVRPQDRARQIVLGGRPVALPVDEQALARGRRVVLLPRARLLGERLGSGFRRIPENRGEGSGQTAGVPLQAPGERILAVPGLESARDPALDPVEARGEEQGLAAGRRIFRNQLGPRGSSLELSNEVSRGATPRP